MFIGRDYYLDVLSALWKKKTSSMVVVSGRRRIGKSTLVERFAELSKCRFIEIEGLAPEKGMTNEKQIANFCERLATATGLPEAKADNWPKAFDALNAAISKTAKTIVFLDEISWMGAWDSAFPAYLKNAWDTQLSHKGALILVLAGSVSAWIQDNILKSRGFVGRISLDVALPEMTLTECREFWGRRTERIALHEILDILSITGGIPKYLQEVDVSLDADENIRRLCFTPEGYLFKDFNSIFSDVFGSAVLKKDMLLRLVEGPFTLSELSQKLGAEANGHISDALSDLVEAGFLGAAIGLNPETGARTRLSQYRLKDNYTRFYLKYIEPREAAIRQGLFQFTTVEQLPGWDALMGFQFENLVINNLNTLCSLIGLEGRLITSAAPYVRRKSASRGGLQIDLLIQTPKALYVVEIKRRKKIASTVELDVQDKIRKLRIPRSKSVRCPGSPWIRL